MKIPIASDHAGFGLKENIIKKFQDVEFEDVGTFSEDSCDYPDYISLASKKVSTGEAERAIVICGSGVGASIVANKYNNVRASLCFNSYMAEMTRRHNDSNILAIGARVVGEDIAFAIVASWLQTEFEGGRHQRRLDKITEIEKSR